MVGYPVSADPVSYQGLADRLRGDISEGSQFEPSGVSVNHGKDILVPLPPELGNGSTMSRLMAANLLLGIGTIKGGGFKCW